MNKLHRLDRIPGRLLVRAHLFLLVLCSLGLAVPHFNARGGRKIDEWLGKSECYLGARKYAREFLIRNPDKILWATDEGWWSFGSKDRQMNQHCTFFEELDLPDEVRHKIYRGNAEKVYGLKMVGK